MDVKVRLGKWPALFISLLSCKGERETNSAAPVELAARDAVAPIEPVAGDWPELADLPRAEPIRVITIPSRPDVPRFSVGGPAIATDLAVVASSQFGFAAVDWRTGALVWTKPSGAKLAPPIVKDGSFILIGDCVTPPAIPESDALLGCMRIVTAAGADEAYVAIHGRARALHDFLGAAGVQHVWIENDRTLRWRRDDIAVTVDLISGVAAPARSAPPPIVVTYKEKRWDISQVEGRIVARQNDKEVWATDHEVTALLGAVWLPDSSPIVRTANISARGYAPEVRLLDVDATGSMNGTAAWTAVPGIALLGHAISPVGDVALAVRLDKSIKRDFIAAYAANALLIYVHPLPLVLRADPVGVGIGLDVEGAPEVVVAFHDGDQVTILPTPSSPPTAPGAIRRPSKFTTP